MFRSKDRYFSNNLADYKGGEVACGDWKPTVLNLANKIVQSQTRSAGDCDGGLYVGISGIAYLFYYLSQHPDFIEDSDTRSRFLCLAQEYCDTVESFLNRDVPRTGSASDVGFFLGNSGLYAVNAALARIQDNEKAMQDNIGRFAALAKHCLPINFLPCGSDEMLVGRAGYICGVLWLQKVTNVEVLPEDILFAICDSVVASGKDYSQKHRSPCPLMYSYYQTEYLGAAHGLSAILQMLLSVPGYLASRPVAQTLVKASVDFYLNLQQPGGNFPAAMDDLDRHGRAETRLVHWCHGAPGAVYMFAKAFLIYRENKYLDACLKCGEVTWQKGLLKKGPGICHGVAGSGYVFLLLYRLTGDQRHLHRAQQFASFMFTEQFEREARTPDCPYSLYEGLAGAVCYLADLLRPQQAAFPFFDVI